MTTVSAVMPRDVTWPSPEAGLRWLLEWLLLCRGRWCGSLLCVWSLRWARCVWRQPAAMAGPPRGDSYPSGDVGRAGCCAGWIRRDVRAGQQEGGHCLGEAVWVLPEEQMAQLREDHEPCTGDAVREQLSVTRVDHGVCGPVHDQRACQDARLPPAADVPRACGCLRRQRPRVRWPGSLEFDEAANKFWPVLDGARRQGILHV